jgi:ParB-like chromosome segregation protein Spo0J
MKTTMQDISLDAVNLLDRSFVVTAGRDARLLEQSIARIGIINSPLLAGTSPAGGFRVVCGFLRVQALAALGVKTFMARVADPAIGEEQLLLASLYDNLSHRQLNPVEQAGAVQRLSGFFPGEEVARRYLPLLGLPPNGRALHRCLALARADAAVLEQLLQGRITERIAAELAGMPQDDRRAFLELFSHVHLSASKQAELIEYCADITRRDGVGLRDVLQHAEVITILENEARDPVRKGEQVRQWIKKKRFPRLNRREDKFAAAQKKLQLPRNMQLSPPPFFEGATYRLHIEINTPEDLGAAATALQGLARSGLMHGLLEE